MTDERALLGRTAEIAAQYLESLDTRPIRPDADYATMLTTVDGPVPDDGIDPMAVIEEPDGLGRPRRDPHLRIPARLGVGRYAVGATRSEAVAFPGT